MANENVLRIAEAHKRLENPIRHLQRAPTPPVPRIGPTLLTVEEVAAILRIPKSEIYKRTCKSATDPFPIPAKRLGKRIRFDMRDVESYLDNL